jgi:hypothetical protein
MESMSFTQTIIDPLRELCYRDGQHTHQRKFTVDCDNAPIHNSKHILEQIEACGFPRMDHPAYIPYLSLCDFFLFVYLRKHLAGQLFDIDELRYWRRIC